jgi:hypothetical protein
VKEKTFAEFNLVNLGAAGTFVARSSTPEGRLRRAIVERLPFTTGVTICPGAEIRDLAGRDPFGNVPPTTKSCVSVMGSDPVRAPALPFYAPNESKWELTLLEAHGRYVLSLYRRLDGRLTYPNPIVEREFGVEATTRGWSTVLALAKILREA